MNQKKYLHYSIEDFTLDKDFLQWVLHPDQENEQFWSEFLRQHPEKKNQVKEASRLIKALKAVEPAISKQRLDQVFYNVKVLAEKPKSRVLLFAKYAAILFFIISTGGILYYIQDKPDIFPVEISGNDSFEKGKVILPDGTVNEFDNEIAEIQQTVSGELTLNDDTISLAHLKGSKNKPALAQIIIPFGKRSEITLSDGTKIWLNSGSQLSYPLTFTGNSREVYLSGEAFFDVNANPEKPFHVITGDLKIRVTGTRFNITSYSSDEGTQAVLLSGKIDAVRNKRFARSVELNPGERIVYNRLSEMMEKDHVNVEVYSSWVQGYLIFENEPVENIFRKLERYYNHKIVTEKLSSLTLFTGKLDLASDLEKVLTNIAFSASFSVEYVNDSYLIKPIKNNMPMD